MTEAPNNADQFERKLRSGRAFLTMLLCAIVANLFNDYGCLPFIVGYTLTFAIAIVIEYWIPPKPPVTFPIWVLKILSLSVPIPLALWLIPKLLSRWIWPPLAYGLPAFILTMANYWIPPLYPIKRDNALWKWVLFSIGFALIFGLIGHYKPY
jgi:hypothetical protein